MLILEYAKAILRNLQNKNYQRFHTQSVAWRRDPKIAAGINLLTKENSLFTR